jgi:predicted Zn-dependent peptidase
MRRIDKVTVSQVRKVAQGIFDRRFMATALIGPFERKEEIAAMLKRS